MTCIHFFFVLYWFVPSAFLNFGPLPSGNPRCAPTIMTFQKHFLNLEKLIGINFFSNIYFLIFVSQINPTCSTHLLQSLGTHFLNFVLKVQSVSESFISFVKMSRSSHRRCSLKTVFLETPQNSQENTCVRDFF